MRKVGSCCQDCSWNAGYYVSARIDIPQRAPTYCIAQVGRVGRCLENLGAAADKTPWRQTRKTARADGLHAVGLQKLEEMSGSVLWPEPNPALVPIYQPVQVNTGAKAGAL